jgi:hypothetical protein
MTQFSTTGFPMIPSFFWTILKASSSGADQSSASPGTWLYPIDDAILVLSARRGVSQVVVLAALRIVKVVVPADLVKEPAVEIYSSDPGTGSFICRTAPRRYGAIY